MKPLIYGFCIFLVYASAGCSVSDNPQRKQLKLLQKGKIKDDSSFIYHLPYEEKKAHLLVQGYFSSYTHKNRAALDFKMRKGTKICAARDGIVIRLKEDGNKGGSNVKYRSYGNFVVIQHGDSSRTGYWYLQFNGVLVNMGQLIGYSGNTGYYAFPHLHFQLQDKNGNDMATRFLTKKGIIYLRPAKYYKAVP